MRARTSTLLVAILAILPLAIVWFAFVTSSATLDQVQSDVARNAFREAAGDVADITAQYVAPLATAADRAARQLSAGFIDPDDPETIDAYLRTTLDAEPRISAIGWYRGDGVVHEMRRDGATIISRRFDPGAAEPTVVTTLTTLSGGLVSETSVSGTLTVPDPTLLAQAELEGTAVSAPTAVNSGSTQSVTFASTSLSASGGTVFIETDLSELGRFVSPYGPTASSRIFIVAGPDLVAHGRPELIGRAPAGTAVASLDDDPTTSAGALALGGDGWQLLTIDESRYHAASASIEGVDGLEWTTVAVGPEDDFSPDFFLARRAGAVRLSTAAIIAILLAIPVARLAVRDVGTLRLAAHRDALTGLLNRRTFEKHGSAMVTAARRRRRSVGALMVDIDHFKQLNDTYGHHAGDEILEALSGRISHAVAKTDLVARLGGDELALLLDGADLAASRSVANRLKNAVTSTPISTNRGPIYVTISIGASATEGMERARLDDLLKAADRALYASKRAGRDRITAVQVARTH